MIKAIGANCDACPLKRMPFVPTYRVDRRQLPCDIVLVGEAPGMNEIVQRVPFVGASGKVLRSTLEQLELFDRVSMIANVCCCRPPGNKKPPPEAVRCCAPRLQRELEFALAQHVVLLGNTAIEAVLGVTKITQVRGRHYPRGEKIYVPTYHPAAVLRSQSLFADFANDLATLKNGKPQIIEPEVVVIEDADELAVVCERLLKHPLLVCDIETSGFNPDKDRVLCISFSYKPELAVVVPEELVNTEPVKRLLQEHRGLLFHNGKFDCLFLWQATGVRAHIGQDSLLLHYAGDERRRTHGLKELVTQIYGIPSWEDELFTYLKKKSDSFVGIPRNVLYEYGGIDASYTLQLYHYLLSTVSEPRTLDVYSMLVDMADRLLPIERHGMLLDMNVLDGVDAQLQAAEKASAAILTEAAGTIGQKTKMRNVRVVKHQNGKPYTILEKQPFVEGKFNPNSTYHIGELLFDKLGLPQISGRSTNAEVIAEMQRRVGDHPVLDALAEFRHVSKLRSTYVVNLRELAGADHRVHPSFQLHGTETGRMAMSRPNLLNIPRTTKSDYAPGIKRSFVAPPGSVLLAADYSQAEMRVMAFLSGDDYLMEQFRLGNDLHTAAGQRMFKTEKPTKEQRMIAKMFNFGLIYGRSAYSVAVQLHIPIDEAQAQLDAFFALMPKAKEWIDNTRTFVREHGYVETPFGRRRHFGLITDDTWKNVQNEAINFPVQSTSSDVTLSAMLRIGDMMQGHAHPLLMVHDSIIVEVPEDRIDWAREIVTEVMISEPRRLLGCKVPFAVDLDVGHSWADI
jgi:uracil-DNA glycosylase family 4